MSAILNRNCDTAFVSKRPHGIYALLVSDFGPVAVGAGRHTHYLGEHAREIVGVVYPELVADLVQFHRRVIDEAACSPDLEKIKVADGAVAGALLEHCRKMRGGEPCIGGDIVERQMPLDVLV